MSADVQLDPDRLRAHALRVDALADRLGSLRWPDLPTQSVDGSLAADVERMSVTVDRAAGCLADLASRLRAVAGLAERGDLLQRDQLRRAGDLP
jgi:hypothetical protein